MDNRIPLEGRLRRAAGRPTYACANSVYESFNDRVTGNFRFVVAMSESINQLIIL